ncbi:hypothetical protein [Streptomyces hydrogenans]|uniref:hypothetical protein n=1 Tax=Streptomyces hydrogenans TaxID=1873719 RepID=UPI003815A1AF
MILTLLKALAGSGFAARILKLATGTLFPLLGPAAQASAALATGRALRPVLQAVLDPQVAVPLVALVAGLLLGDTPDQGTTTAAKFIAQTLF